jgi:hypothetical protein
MMAWAGFLRNEARLLMRHPLTWAAIAGSAVFAFLFSRGAPFVPADETLHELLRLNLMVPMMFLPFVAGALAPMVLLRESATGAAEMFGSYPVTLRQWLVTRVGALFLLLLLGSLIAQVLFFVVLAIEQPAQLPQIAVQSLYWLAIIQIPACLLWAALAARLATWRANSGLLYVACGLLWLVYIAVSTVSGTPLIVGSTVLFEPLSQAMLLLDPYAAASLLAPAEMRGSKDSIHLLVLGGRAFWLLVVLLLLRSIRTTPGDVSRSKRFRGKPAADGSGKATKSASWQVPQWAAHYALHLRYAVRDKVFPLLAFAWIVLFLTGAIGGMDYAEPLSRVDPDSRDALNRVVWDLLIPAGALLLLYLADRICRLYPAAQMHELFAASPYHASKLMLVQLAAIWSLTGGFILAAGLSVMAAQAIAGSPIQPDEYPFQLWPAFSRLALFGAIFVAIHGIFRSRIVANLAAFAVMALGVFRVLAMLSIHHPLARPMGTPISMPDHYWGYGGGLYGHHYFLVFWTIIVLVFVVVAIALHHRTLPFAHKRLRERLRNPAMVIGVLGAALASWTGLSIHSALGEEGALSTPQDRIAWRAAYERDFGEWSNRPQPEIAEISSKVDFFPDQQRARLVAELILVNRTNSPIERVLVGRNQLSGGGHESISFEAAQLAFEDGATGQKVYTLDQPLLPGDEARLHFALEIAQSGLAPASMPLVLRPSYNSLPAYALLPVIGYNRELELRDPANRREHGLPELDARLPSQLPDAAYSRERDTVMLDSVVSTSRGHSAVAQGRLLERRERDGRVYSRYRTEQPIRRLPAFFSVSWEAQSIGIGPHDASIHVPTAVSKSDPNFLAMEDTVSLLSEKIAPYQGSAIHLLAVPEIGFTGFALPQIIQVSNRLAFRAEPDEGAGFSQAYRRAAHETAHQWFGHLLGHGIADEHAFLVESLAKYVELPVIEQRFGKTAANALVEWEWGRYRAALRDARAEISPLIDAEDVEDQYSRSTIVFACLRELVGDDAILDAASALAGKTLNQGHAMRSIDFVNELASATTPDQTATVRSLLLGTSPLDTAIKQAGCAETYSLAGR